MEVKQIICSTIPFQMHESCKFADKLEQSEIGPDLCTHPKVPKVKKKEETKKILPPRHRRLSSVDQTTIKSSLEQRKPCTYHARKPRSGVFHFAQAKFTFMPSREKQNRMVRGGWFWWFWSETSFVSVPVRWSWKKPKIKSGTHPESAKFFQTHSQGRAAG